VVETLWGFKSPSSHFLESFRFSALKRDTEHRLLDRCEAATSTLSSRCEARFAPGIQTRHVYAGMFGGDVGAGLQR
jgi:hypothetical protein